MCKSFEVGCLFMFEEGVRKLVWLEYSKGWREREDEVREVSKG